VPHNASDSSSCDHPGNMGQYMRVIIAIALIWAVIFLMARAVSELTRDLARRPYQPSLDVDDDDPDDCATDASCGAVEINRRQASDA
jgi:hypothetical protein